MRSSEFRRTAFNNDGLKVPTLAEVIDLVQQVEAETGRKIGIYPETKHPTFFLEQGYNTSQLLIDTLVAENFTDPSRIFIQSFEVSNLKELKDSIMPTAGVDIPLVQLFGGSGRPYDFVVNNDSRTYTDLSTPDGLAEIAEYAAGIGPNKQRIVPLSTVDADGNGQPDDLNGDGVISDGDRITGTPTTLIADAHAAGLLVHPYTFRDESFFLPASYNGDALAELKQFIELGADGYFTDFPGTGEDARTSFIIPPAVSNLNRSQGFEGMATNPGRTTLYPLLEGTVVGDPTGALRIYEFDPAASEFTGIVGYYQLESPTHAIGDFTVINENEYLVIERDNNQGTAAAFKRIYKVDFTQQDAGGFVEKQEVANLLEIQDPNDLNQDGSGTYTMPFQTIEDVLVVDANTILVANDNNYPFSVGRPPAIDNNEIVLLELETPLNLDPRVGLAGLNVKSFNGAGGSQTFTVNAGETAVIDNFGGIGVTGTQTAAVLAELDTIKFVGEGLTATQMLLNQNGANLEITFEGSADTKVVLTSFDLQDLDNFKLLPYLSPDQLGNILFDGDSTIQDSYDVFNADWQFDRILPTLGTSRVTFLNQLDNNTRGFENSNDVMNGLEGDDFLFGLSGDDVLRGGIGLDNLNGGRGNDFLDGGADNDFLNGGLGDDILQGGSGNDIFALSVNSGTDTILDFEDGADLLALPAGLGFNKLSILQGSGSLVNDTLIQHQSKTLAILSGVQATSINASNFINV